MFNQYFLNIGNCKDHKITSDRQMDNKINDSLYLREISPEEIKNAVASLKNKRSSGWVEISSVILKNCLMNILLPLTFLINNIFQLGVFPDCLKTSIV